MVEAFTSAEQLLTSLQENKSNDALRQDTLAALERARQSIAAADLVSDNEELDEVQTNVLKFFLVEFYLSNVHQEWSVNDPQERKRHLVLSIGCGEQFLFKMDQLGLLSELQRKLLRNKDLMLSAQEARAHKIENFKRRKELEAKIKLVSLRREKLIKESNVAEDVEEVDREFYITLLEESIEQCFAQIGINRQEIQMLEMMLARREAIDSGKPVDDLKEAPKSRPSVYKVGCPHDIEQIKIPSRSGASIDELVRKRRDVRETVFRNPNPATMTLDEFAEREMARMNISQQGGAIVEQEEEDSDDDAVSDRKTLKARNWDNWKDDNERGIGNRLSR